MITGHTRLMAIVGDPIAQAKTPELVNRELARRRLDAVLVPLRVPAASLDAAIAGLGTVGNLCGAVVTMPHKEAVIRWLDQPSDRVREAGTCNVVRVGPAGWDGDVTDGVALAAALRQAGAKLRDARVFLAGAGGAARAIAHALAAEGVAGITLHNRTTARADDLAASVQRHWPEVDVAVSGPELHGEDVVVNATSLGMTGVGDGDPFDVASLRSGSVVADVVIAATPDGRTPLLVRAAAAGCQVATGRAMLEAQIQAFVDFMVGGAVDGRVDGTVDES